jgi:TonB family protein
LAVRNLFVPCLAAYAEGMSPQSLIFSSDRETSRLLGQALLELEFEVESCSEIFAAIERITTQSFDVIVADWDDGLEALFLLKTSRELKMNAGAIPVAVCGTAESRAAASQAGAAIILGKPVVVEQAKFTLLSADVFLRGMRSWIPTQQPSNTARGATRSYNPQAGCASSVDDISLSSATDLRGRFSQSRAFIHRGELRVSSSKKHWMRLITMACSLGIALSSAGYVFSAPVHSQEIATSVHQIYKQAVAKTQTWLEKSDAPPDDENIVLAQNATHAPRIQVTPVHEYVERPASSPILTQTEAPPPTTSRPEYIPVAAAARIPDSLRSSALSAKNLAERMTPTLLAGLEPVNLSEDLAAQLLLQKVQPSYPQKALQAGLQGPVVFPAWIARVGSIRDLKLIAGSLMLGQAAYSAVKQWNYKPYLLNGQAVETQTYVTVNFVTP